MYHRSSSNCRSRKKRPPDFKTELGNKTQRRSKSPGDPGQFNLPTSTRRMVAGRKERSRCRLDSLARSPGLLHTVGCGDTRLDLQSSPCSSTLPSSLPFAKAESNSTSTISTNSETATSKRIECRSSECGLTNALVESFNTKIHLITRRVFGFHNAIALARLTLSGQRSQLPLADAIVLATESELSGHEVFYIASPDNVGGRNFGEILHQYYGDKIELRPASCPDASGISSEKAHRMLCWTPKRSWSDCLGADGNALSRD